MPTAAQLFVNGSIVPMNGTIVWCEFGGDVRAVRKKALLLGKK